MGVVYRAYHVPLARTGAVKVMHGISPDPDSIARFRREAQAIAQMRHPNILNVFDFGEFQGTPYMIVEYVPGGSLAARLNKGPIDTADALEYLEGIATGLDYAHSLGIVHRDVKPANVLVARDGTPIISDFGLVKLLQSASLTSMTGATTGTPAYMAPEQVTGSQVGPAADRYSLATMAYEMLTGEFPFEDDSVLEMLYAHVHREPVPPSARRPELGSGVDAVILRGLSRDPDARWERCEAFVAALRSALEAPRSPAVERTVVIAPPVAATVPIATPKVAAANATVVMPLSEPVATVPAPAATPASAAPARSHRRRNTIVAAAILLVLLISTVGLIAASLIPTLSLSSTTVHPGDALVVTASRVPRNQAGEIQLLSRLTTFPFRADGSGNVTREIFIPTGIALGDHLVKICWNGTCHAQATLHVVSLTAMLPDTAPSPGASPTPSSNSPSPTSSTGPTPSPPGGTSTYPSPTPAHAPPSPSPTPPAPTPPAPTPASSIALVSVSQTGSTTVTFHYFYSGSATITIHQGGTTRSVTVSVAPGSTTSVIFKTPTGFLVTAQPLTPQAYVTVSSLTSNSVNVTV
jgi:serine/threonine-protein kinase